MKDSKLPNGQDLKNKKNIKLGSENKKMLNRDSTLGELKNSYDFNSDKQEHWVTLRLLPLL